jgi:general stress protein 26
VSRNDPLNYTKAHKLLLVIVSVFWWIVPVAAQSQDRTKLTTVAREVITAARYCALITLDAKGRAQSRTLDPFPPDENFVIHFGTNVRSRKLTEIRRHPRVTLYYFDREGQGYVTIQGAARVVTDPKEKAKWWKEEWKSFYPKREQDYAVVVVTPERLEVISEKHKIFGDPKTWAPPSVSFKRF